MQNEVLLEIGRLVSWQSIFLVAMCGFMVIGFVYLAHIMRAVSADTTAIANLVAEVLRRIDHGR